jgi:hypothetical protein
MNKGKGGKRGKQENESDFVILKIANNQHSVEKT